MPRYENANVFGANRKISEWKLSMEDVWWSGLSLAMSLSSFVLRTTLLTRSHASDATTHTKAATFHDKVFNLND